MLISSVSNFVFINKLAVLSSSLTTILASYFNTSTTSASCLFEIIYSNLSEFGGATITVKFLTTSVAISVTFNLVVPNFKPWILASDTTETIVSSSTSHL